MAFPAHVLSRLTIPIIIAAFFMHDIPNQISLYDEIQTYSDSILSVAKREGEGLEIYDFIIGNWQLPLCKSLKFNLLYPTLWLSSCFLVGAGSAGSVLAKR